MREESVFYAGDCREALGFFIREGHAVRLAYMDPPFLTGRDFGAYRDGGDRQELLRMLEETLALCRELLLPDGSLYLHVDHRLSAHARLLLDGVFGEDCFANEIIWSYQSGGRSSRRFSRKHDTILFYGKGKRPYFDPQAVGVPRGEARRNHMRRGLDEQGAYAAIRSGGKEYRYYDQDTVPPSDVWCDIPHLQQRDPERTGYPTQKPEKLLERIILASSREGDWVLDPFCGSGTTLAAAHRLGRKGLGADASPQSLATVRKRLADVPVRYILPEGEDEDT